MKNNTLIDIKNVFQENMLFSAFDSDIGILIPI